LLLLRFGLRCKRSVYLRFQNSAELLSSLTMALSLIILARCANFKVETVSLIALVCGLSVQMITVFALPPSESLSRCVSFDSRKLTKFSLRLLPFLLFSESS